MASNLSTIGFVFDSEDDFRAAMVRYAAGACAQAACSAGSYGIWRSRSGAEIWFHLAPGDSGSTEICGLTPFFEGQSDIAVNVTKPIDRDGDNPFEGSLHVWVNPDKSGEGSYPLVFDVVDYARYPADAWPAVRHVRLCAFSRELTAFADEADLYKSNAADGEARLNLTSKAFIPVGLFASAMSKEDGHPRMKPASTSAMLTGKVLEHQTLTNEATGKAFEYLFVESLDASFDVIADPEIVKGTIAEGGYVEVMASLFGRFID